MYLLPFAVGLGIILGYLLRKHEETEAQPTLGKLPKKPVYSKDAKELEETSTFLAVLHDDTLDDIKLKQYKPIKVRNRAPLAIEAQPHITSASMQRIRVYMQQHGPLRQRTELLAIEGPKTVGKHRKED
jgi:hypothetical protein